MAEAKLDEKQFKNLCSEVLMARKVNQDYLENQMREAIGRYTGVWVPEIGVNWDIVLNEVYPIIQYNLPSIFFRNPRVFLKPRNKTYIAKKRNPTTGLMEEVVLDSSKSARTQEAILNYVLSEIRYKQEVRKVLTDALMFPHGVLWHGYKGNFGISKEQSIYIKEDNVFVRRLSPMKFLKDPAVYMANIDEASWVGRSFSVRLEELIEDDSLDVDKNLKGKLGYGDPIAANKPIKLYGMDVIQAGSQPLIDFAEGEFKNAARAKFVEVHEIFMRPSAKEKKEGEKGKVVLFTYDQKKPLRVSKWPYKAEGWPAIILQFNELNDCHFGLPDIDTYKQIADQKNAIVNIQLRNAQENSKVWVALAKDIMNEEDVEKIKQGDNTIILFPGDTVQGKMAVASPGNQGSSELYLIDQRIDRNLQDKSGVTDLKKGFLQSGEESAASVQLRAQGGSARPAYRQDLMADFLKDSCHLLNQYLKQFFPIDKAVRIVGSLDIEWSNDPSEEEVQADTDVEIDVVSMLPENPEKEIQELQTVLNLLVTGLQDPVIRAQIEKEGYTVELSPIIENLLTRLKIKDPNIFRRIKPEESEGYVSVAEMRAAKANIEAAISGSPEIPSPPALGQDHKARIEAYTPVVNLLAEVAPDSQAVQLLTQLIQIQGALLEEEMQEKAPTIGAAIKKPTFETVGA